MQAMLNAAFAELERDAPRMEQLNAGLDEDSALAEALRLSSGLAEPSAEVPPFHAAWIDGGVLVMHM